MSGRAVARCVLILYFDVAGKSVFHCKVDSSRNTGQCTVLPLEGSRTPGCDRLHCLGPQVPAPRFTAIPAPPASPSDAHLTPRFLCGPICVHFQGELAGGRHLPLRPQTFSSKDHRISSRCFPPRSAGFCRREDSFLSMCPRAEHTPEAGYQLRLKLGWTPSVRERRPWFL